MKTWMRPLQSQDLNLYFRWANDPVTRSNSLTTDPITMETHQAWFERQMKDEREHHYVFHCGREAVGQIRFSVGAEAATLSYSLDAAWRGKRLSGRLLALGIEHFRIREGTLPIVATVKEHNLQSWQALERLGFRQKSRQNGLVNLELS